MVAQFTQPLAAAPPQTASPTLSPAQWAQLSQLIQSQPQQSPYQQQAAPPSTSAYTSTGTMSAIDPALLQAQWLQYQNGQLAQSAIIPQYAPQYAPQGEFYSDGQIDAIADYYAASQRQARAASEYINYLRNELATVDAEYLRLLEFSGIQDALVQKFLYDRNFALDYARGTWPIGGVSNEFMNKFADTYLEIAALSPIANQNRSPEFTGNPNMQFSAAVVPANAPQMSIPPLPSSNGSATPYITLDQYLAAQQQGQVAQARAAALQNPAGLYGALFQ